MKKEKLELLIVYLVMLLGGLILSGTAQWIFPTLLLTFLAIMGFLVCCIAERRDKK